jgi:hypothetical protein
MTTLQESLADYLQIRRRLGFEMPQDGRLLEGFVEFLNLPSWRLCGHGCPWTRTHTAGVSDCPSRVGSRAISR